MYRLNGIGWLLFVGLIFFFIVCSIFYIKDRKIELRIKRKRLLLIFGIVVLVVSYEIYCERKLRIIPGIEERSEGEVSEISLRYLGQLSAYDEKTLGYENLEKITFWWQKRREFDGFLGLELPDWQLDFENHYYVVSYGRPLRELYCDTTKWYAYGYEDWAGYDSDYEFDMEIPYQSGVVYVYEMDKTKLATIEF